MTDIPSSESTDGIPTYTTGGDPDGRFADYYPAWLDNLADDVTIEGSLLDGAARGPDGVRTIVGAIRSLCERQQFNFAGSYGENAWLEDYIAHVGGEPVGCAVLVTRNAAGQTQHVAAKYRPRSSLLLLSRLAGENLAGTPLRQVLPRPRVLIPPHAATRTLARLDERPAPRGWEGSIRPLAPKIPARPRNPRLWRIAFVSPVGPNPSERFGSDRTDRWALGWLEVAPAALSGVEGSAGGPWRYRRCLRAVLAHRRPRLPAGWWTLDGRGRSHSGLAARPTRRPDCLSRSCR